MPNAKKIDLAPTLKALTKSLEQTTKIVESLKNGVGAESFSQLQDLAKETGSVLRDVVEELSGKPVEAAKADETPVDETKANTRTLTAATAALEELTSVVAALKQKSEMTPEEFAKVIEELTAISHELSAIGERYPSPKAAEQKETPAEMDPAKEQAQKAAMKKAEDDAAAAAAAAAEAAPAAVTPAAEAAPVAAATELTVEEVGTAATAMATAADAAANAEISKAAFDSILKAMNDTMCRGGVMMDTADLNMLQRVVQAMARCMDGGTPADTMAKAESVSRDFLRTLASDIRELGKVTEQKAVAKSLKGAALAHALLQSVNDVFVSKVEAGRAAAVAKSADQKAILEVVTKAVAEAVKPLQTTITKLTEDNAKLRTEIGKRDEEPARRASSPETIEVAPVEDHSKIFPMNYNARSLAD